GQLARDVEPVAAGHLDVEEDEVRPLVRDRRDGLLHVRRLADQGDVLAPGEERADLLAGQPLVVDDQGAHQRNAGVLAGWPGGVPPPWNGIDISTSNPPSSDGPHVKW